MAGCMLPDRMSLSAAALGCMPWMQQASFDPWSATQRRERRLAVQLSLARFAQVELSDMDIQAPASHAFLADFGLE